MKSRFLLVLIISILFLSACQQTNRKRPIHYKTKVIKKVVHVHHRDYNHKKLKTAPPIANLKPRRGMSHYRILNDPVVVLTFHNKPGESIGTQMTKYLNSIANINQYHIQVNATGNTTYVTLKQLNFYHQTN